MTRAKSLRLIPRKHFRLRPVLGLLLAVGLLSIPAARADEPYARTRTYDLQNARLQLRFDVAEKRVMGEVTHTLAPLRDGLTQLEFDSVGLTISSVTIAGRPAKYETSATKLLVALDRPARAGEKLNVVIRYEGRPKRGLTFILPDKNYPNRPIQIWTQGQAEEIRNIVPIYDYPNDLTTSEIITTVPKSWVTLSNGKLISVKEEAGGMKTWHWRQSQPHATYLISLVAGEFDEAKETWRNLPVPYYVPRGRASRIAPTFARTRAMLELLSEKYGVMYPWDKYAQIAVEEHFGGMEHTSATTLTDTSLVAPELVPELRKGSDGLIVHELAHQWFGDLVTCKDWGHVWINEGFATHSELLWDEKQLGADEAAYTFWQWRNQWMGGQRLFTKPIVRHDFTDSSDNGGNNYTKAGLVIEMLRRELGDADFFRSLKHFLEKHRHRNVVTADVVRAIEEATGKNVDFFFDQWVYGAGAPKFEVSYTFDESAKQVTLAVKQTQKVEGDVPLFRVPVEIEITTPQGAKSHRVTVSKAEETFAFPVDARPRMVLFDKGNMILKSLEFKKDPQEWIYQLRNAATAPDRLDAARALAEIKNNEDVAAALGEAARSDRFWAVRSESLRALGRIGGPAAQKQILSAVGEPQAWVRSVAVSLLGSFKDDATVAATLDKIFREDKAYGVRGAALRSLAQQKAPNAFDALRAAAGMDSPDERIRGAALSAMGALGDDRAVPLLLEWSAVGKPISVRSPAIASLGRMAKQDKEVMKKLIAYLDEPYQFIRFSAVLALAERGDSDAIAPLEKLAKDSNVSAGMSDFIQSQIARLKPKPAGAQPGAAGGEAPKGPAQAGAAEPSNQQILQAIEKLQKDTAEIKERLKKLEERVSEKK